MTPRDWFGNVWPSLLALVGTLAVVMALLVVIGRDSQSELAEGPGDVVAEATDTAAPGTTPTATEPAGPVTAAAEIRRPVRVLNATSVSGLAKQTAERLRAGGWEVASIGDFGAKEQSTTVYFPEGFEEAADALRAQFLEIDEVSPRTGQMRGDQLTLVLGSDYAQTVASPGGTDG